MERQNKNFNGDKADRDLNRESQLKSQVEKEASITKARDTITKVEYGKDKPADMKDAALGMVNKAKNTVEKACKDATCEAGKLADRAKDIVGGHRDDLTKKYNTGVEFPKGAPRDAAPTKLSSGMEYARGQANALGRDLKDKACDAECKAKECATDARNAVKEKACDVKCATKECAADAKAAGNKWAAKDAKCASKDCAPDINKIMSNQCCTTSKCQDKTVGDKAMDAVQGAYDKVACAAKDTVDYVTGNDKCANRQCK